MPLFRKLKVRAKTGRGLGEILEALLSLYDAMRAEFDDPEVPQSEKDEFVGALNGF